MIQKSFDDMTGNGQVMTSSVMLLKQGGWLSAQQTITLVAAIVVGDDFRQPWLISNTSLLEWYYLSDTDVLALVDGKRHKFEGFIQSSDTEIIGSDVLCNESFHVPVTEDFLQALSVSQSARLRLGGNDFEMSEEFKADVRELLTAI